MLNFIRSRSRCACRPAHGGADGSTEEQVADGGGKSQPKRRKRKRRPRYPKGFDPENPGPPPDPERWLPKHERSDFKKRRKGKGKQAPASKGAQVCSRQCKSPRNNACLTEYCHVIVL